MGLLKLFFLRVWGFGFSGLGFRVRVLWDRDIRLIRNHKAGFGVGFYGFGFTIWVLGFGIMRVGDIGFVFRFRFYGFASMGLWILWCWLWG